MCYRIRALPPLARRSRSAGDFRVRPRSNIFRPKRISSRRRSNILCELMCNGDAAEGGNSARSKRIGVPSRSISSGKPQARPLSGDALPHDGRRLGSAPRRVKNWSSNKSWGRPRASARRCSLLDRRGSSRIRPRVYSCIRQGRSNLHRDHLS